MRRSGNDHDRARQGKPWLQPEIDDRNHGQRRSVGACHRRLDALAGRCSERQRQPSYRKSTSEVDAWALAESTHLVEAGLIVGGKTALR